MSECKHRNRDRNVREYGRFSHHCVDCDKDLDPDHNQFLEEIKKLEEENRRLLVLLEKCWNEFTKIELVAGIAPDRELYDTIWKEIK